MLFSIDHGTLDYKFKNLTVSKYCQFNNSHILNEFPIFLKSYKYIGVTLKILKSGQFLIKPGVTRSPSWRKKKHIWTYLRIPNLVMID